MLRTRISTGKRLYLRRSGFVVASGLVLSILSFWRSEGPQDLQPPILADVVSLLPWWIWTQLLLIAGLLLTFEAAHRELSAKSVMPVLAQTSRQSRKEGLIDDLSRLWAEANEMKGSHPGSGPRIWFVGGEETEYDRRKDREYSDYDTLLQEWSDKVATRLENGGRDFLVDWNRTSLHERIDLLPDIIKELRSR